jgi:hypothetical protein
VADTLRKVSQTYRAATEYRLAADLTLLHAGTKTGAPGHMLFAFRSPNRYRMETTAPETAAT